MKVEQWSHINGEWSQKPEDLRLGKSANLIFIFGARSCLENQDLLRVVRGVYPKDATYIGCSTAGEILDAKVLDNSLVVTAVELERTPIRAASCMIHSMEESQKAGEELAKTLNQSGLKHVFVLSDGTQVNGSELVRGIASQLPPSVAVTGGLAGDGSAFQKTIILFNDVVAPAQVAAIGFFGDALKIGYGSMGGWDVYGISRKVTRSKGNVLYELDGKPALEIYKLYLGEKAKDLPSSALLFPLSLKTGGNGGAVVRTVLGVDDQEQSMTFAGDIPEGIYVQFMKANFTRLVEGASQAASTSYNALQEKEPDLAILVSCVGRKLVLKQRTEEETEAVRQILGSKPKMLGFYSYGEISPFTPNAKCELHNQTMTITTFLEEK